MDAPRTLQPLARVDPFESHKNNVEASSCHGVSGLAVNRMMPNEVAVASLGGDVALLDVRDNRIVRSWHPHRHAVTDIAFHPTDSSLVITSSRDGCVEVSDTRVPSSAGSVGRIQLSLDMSGDAEVWSVAVGGSTERLLACSIDATVQLYDLRVLAAAASNPRRRRSRHTGLLCNFDQSHSDNVSVVRFHPSHRSLLVTGADDCLLVVHDTQQCTEPPSAPGTLSGDMTVVNTGEEDEGSDAADDVSVIGTCHNESPPRCVCFAGESYEVLCVASTTEMLRAWNCLHFIKRETKALAAGGAPFASQGERVMNGSSVGVESSFPVSTAIPPQYGVRNCPRLQAEGTLGSIVGLHYDAASKGLYAIGGSVRGVLALFDVRETHCELIGASLPPSYQALVGHSQLVRAADIIPRVPGSSVDAPILLSGCEEGFICYWMLQHGVNC